MSNGSKTLINHHYFDGLYQLFTSIYGKFGNLYTFKLYLNLNQLLTFLTVSIQVRSLPVAENGWPPPEASWQSHSQANQRTFFRTGRSMVHGGPSRCRGGNPDPKPHYEWDHFITFCNKYMIWGGIIVDYCGLLYGLLSGLDWGLSWIIQVIAAPFEYPGAVGLPQSRSGTNAGSDRARAKPAPRWASATFCLGVAGSHCPGAANCFAFP